MKNFSAALKVNSVTHILVLIIIFGRYCTRYTELINTEFCTKYFNFIDEVPVYCWKKRIRASYIYINKHSA